MKMREYKQYFSRGDVLRPRSTRLMQAWRRKIRLARLDSQNANLVRQRGPSAQEMWHSDPAKDVPPGCQSASDPVAIAMETTTHPAGASTELGFVQSSESATDFSYEMVSDGLLAQVNEVGAPKLTAKDGEGLTDHLGRNEPTANIPTEHPTFIEECEDGEELTDQLGRNEPTDNIPPEYPTFIEDCEDRGPTDHLGGTLPPLCSHTECTADDILVMTLSLGFRHNLPYVAMVDILKMFNAVYGEKKIKASKYSFMKRLSIVDKELDIEYHHYCNKCSVYVCVESDDALAVCSVCKADLSQLKFPTYFASISMKSQLIKLLSNESIADMILNYRFSRKVTENHVADIYDGSHYSKLSAPGGILSPPQNFSFSFFVDGVPLGKTKKSLWPIYISINELPPEERRKNILLVGLYYGPHDPNQGVFLKPFVDETNMLSSEGFEWSYRGKLLHSMVVPLVAIADSVARCQLLNMQTFTAYYGCTFCYQMTQTTDKKLKFVLPTGRVQLRSLESYQHDILEVSKRRHYTVEKKRQFRGVKGISSLAFLKHFDLFSCMVVDSMHCILQGVCRNYFELVFEDKRKKFWLFLKQNKRYAIEDVYKVIDSRMNFLQPPTSIPRAPRSIKEHGTWKANEWRSWLLFYCIPCLTGLFKKKHLVHIAMLCKGYSLLMQPSVSQDEISEAHRLFQYFSFYYQQYFGKEYMFYNIHLLSHICRGTTLFGPLWTHNAFMFEANNRHLLNLCKSPFQVVKEVSKKYLIMKSLPHLVPVFASSDNTLWFCQKMLEKNLVRFKRTQSCILVGAGTKTFDLTDEENLFLRARGVDSSSLTFYNKVLFKGMRVSTSQFSVGKRHNDSVLNLVNGQSCELIAIFTYDNCVSFLIRYMLPCEASVLKSNEVEINHIVQFGEYGTLDLVKPADVHSQCILIQTGHNDYCYSKIGLSLLLGD